MHRHERVRFRRDDYEFTRIMTRSFWHERGGGFYAALAMDRGVEDWWTD